MDNQITWSEKIYVFYHGFAENLPKYGIAHGDSEFILVSVHEESKTIGSYKTLDEAKMAAEVYHIWRE